MIRDDKWYIRFLQLARLVASWSQDPSTKTGAVIVRPDKTVCSVGFNGFPKPMKDRPEDYNNRAEKYSRIVHCEMNALIHSREPVAGYTLYTWPLASCERCAVHMIQAGISKVAFPTIPPELIERWGASLEKSKSYFEEAGVLIIEVPHEKLG